jgi:hypothetical protein
MLKEGIATGRQCRPFAQDRCRFVVAAATGPAILPVRENAKWTAVGGVEFLT